MIDSIGTILIIGGCALFLGYRAFQTFRGTGSSCSCGCAESCSNSHSSCEEKCEEFLDLPK
jgi:hypothetical protein